MDIILDLGKELIPIEVKTSTTPKPEMARNLKIFKADFPHKVQRGYVIHPGDITLPFGQGIFAVPFTKI